MSVSNFLDYNNYINLQNKQLEIWGQPCRIYIPSNITAMGYEDTLKTETDKMGVGEVLSNSYTILSDLKIWINFTITKSVFYKFNWFPEDADELCLAFLNSNSEVRENSYIRTSLPQQTSIWGDMIFEVKKIQDVGLAKTLERMYFLKPLQNQELQDLLIKYDS